ncbi:unnamed protein product [Paramecium octaurelia]|uniref:VWFA domain-containing protein n=1 Tax=Paramecium octaurelia TaxID=43137 RepID=A0A8S1XLL6_PAROT|nr:unnamed protein product [Paramecium octaurelia]
MALLGFESAPKSRLNNILPRISCSGATAFRDAVVKGNQLMLQLFALFCKKGAHDKFKFVHVVLTDGEDNKSQISLQDFLKYQVHLKNELPEDILQTFYIGVNVESNQTVQQEMRAILQCSGKSAQYFPIHSNGINEIFQKIQMQIGLRVQQKGIVIESNQKQIAFMQKQLQPVLQMKVNNYIVLFTLDISGSMEGNWGKVCNAVSGFLGNLGSNDLVSGIVFNDKVEVVTQSNAEPQKSVQSQQCYNQNQYQVSNRRDEECQIF